MAFSVRSATGHAGTQDEEEGDDHLMFTNPVVLACKALEVYSHNCLRTNQSLRGLYSVVVALQLAFRVRP